MSGPSREFSFQIYPFSSHCLQTYDHVWVWVRVFRESEPTEKIYIKHCVCVCVRVCVCVCMQIEREKEVYFKELVWMIVRSANLEIYTAGQQAANL